MANIPVALQMYTVREDAAKDFRGTLRSVAELGYAGVELAGVGGLAASELKQTLDDLGLGIAGAHVALNLLENELDQELDYFRTAGAEFIACPWLPENLRNAEGYRSVAETLNRAGKRARERGIQLCYHNHAFEFDTVDGQTGFDILFGQTDPDLVKIELDTYWAEHAGRSAADIIRRHAGRIPLLHVKDMTAGADHTFAEVGEGVMDWDAIFAAAESGPGVKWYIVEQDSCQRPPLESAEISIGNLRRMGKV